MKVLKLVITNLSNPAEPILELEYSWHSVVVGVIIYSACMFASIGVFASVVAGLLTILLCPLFLKLVENPWFNAFMVVNHALKLGYSIITGFYPAVIVHSLLLAGWLWNFYGVLDNKPDNNTEEPS